MAEKYPRIRIPIQPARPTFFAMLTFCGFFLGIFLGILIGHRYFGVIGAVLAAVIGGFLGLVIDHLPGHFMQEQMSREMQKSSNEELKAKRGHPTWSCYQTLALLNLQVRGEDVQSYLPRVLALLESNDSMARLFGRDALRLVYTGLAKQLDDFGYDAKASTENCRAQVAELRERLA